MFKSGYWLLELTMLSGDISRFFIPSNSTYSNFLDYFYLRFPYYYLLVIIILLLVIKALFSLMV